MKFKLIMVGLVMSMANLGLASWESVDNDLQQSSAQDNYPIWITLKCPAFQYPTDYMNKTTDSSGRHYTGSVFDNTCSQPSTCMGDLMEVKYTSADKILDCVYGNYENGATEMSVRFNLTHAAGDIVEEHVNANTLKFKRLRQFKCPHPENFVPSHMWQQLMAIRATFADQEVECPITLKNESVCRTEAGIVAKPNYFPNDHRPEYRTHGLKRMTPQTGAVIYENNQMRCYYDVGARHDNPKPVYIDIFNNDACKFQEATLPKKPNHCAGMKVEDCVLICPTGF